jgi:hypothetical protein
MDFIDAVGTCPTLADAQAQLERLWPLADLFLQPKVRSAPVAATSLPVSYLGGLKISTYSPCTNDAPLRTGAASACKITE